MSRIRKWISLLMAAALIAGLIPQTALGPSHAHATTYRLVTLKGTTPADVQQNVILKGNQLRLGNEEAAKFFMTDWGDGTVSLRAQENGMFVTANGTSSLAATATAVKITETFAKEPVNGKFALKSLSNNNYITTVTSGSGSNSTTTLQANIGTSNKVQQQFTITDVTPSSSAQEIRVLEITDDGTSELLPLLGESKDPVFKIESLRMKQFVAQRDELDGRYDAIYIGKGAYNATPVWQDDRDHNTKSIMNDITNLKMNEIKTAYIDRGLPVIAYSQKTKTSSSGALFQNTAGILKNALDDYAVSLNAGNANTFVPASNRSNVIFVGDSQLASKSAFLDATSLIEYAAERPRIVLTSKPTDYTEDQDKIYVAGDTLTYTFDVANVSNIKQRSLVANLYVGIDSVLKFDSNNLLLSQPVTETSANTVTFRLPKGYSGVHYWKLELVDQGSKKRDIQSGVLRFRDELTKINVLQILPGNANSSLLDELNMKQSYLKSADYEITIKTMTISTFNSSGYKNLNGYYDMLIFGFADSYNGSAPINEAAAIAVNTYIATGQSVMFTHDTVYQGNSNWIKYFQNSTGQLDPMTNMGLNAPNTSKTTKKVNEGLLTRFPFNISEKITEVNTTHNQYFALNLEDPKLIPWYNITGGPRDDDDSWNHYYTYSYGNVTYSGTGHTNTKFPDWEQRLFVNTMYRAFIGSNHAPTVTVSTPTNYAESGKIIPSYNKVLLSYTAQDFDVIDRTLSTAVTFKYKPEGSSTWTQTQVKPYTEDTTGKILSESYDNPLPNGGDLIIYVSAKDKSGAVSDVKEITTKVMKVTANVDLTRTLSSNVVNNQIEKNVPFTMTYTVTPKAIPFKNGIEAKDLVIKNFKLDEQLPANLEALASDTSPLLLDPVVTGSLGAGYRLTGKLADIAYRLSTDGKSFVADPVSFTVKVTPKQNGNYLIQNSNLSFTDFYVNGTTVTKDIERSLQFQPLAVEAITRMASLSLTDAIIAKDEESILTPAIGPADVSNKVLNWKSDRPDLVTVTSNGVIRGIAEGTAKITATATDGSGLTAVANVTVVVPGINITGPNTVNVDDTINLEAKLILANESLTDLTWSLGSGQSSLADLNNGSDEMKKSLVGVNAGAVDVTVTAKTNKGKTYTKTYRVTVIQPIHMTLPADIHIGLGAEWKRDLWNTALGVTPEASKPGMQSYTNWTSSDTTIAEAGANNGVVIGNKTGSVTVGASYRKNPKTIPVASSTRVTVVDLNVPEQVTIGQGQSLDVKALVGAAPSEVSGAVLSRLSWSDDADKNFAAVNPAGVVTGVAAGIENVVVAYKQTDGGPIVIQKTIQVNVVALSGPATVKIGKGQSIDLKEMISVLPSSMSADLLPQLSWSDEAGKNLASVSTAGIVQGVETGVENVTVVYRASPNGPALASWTIQVQVVSLSGPAEIDVGRGAKLDLKKLISGAPLSLSDELLGNLYWSDDADTDFAVVDTNGIVTGKTAGTEIVTVSYKESPTGLPVASWTVKVNVIALDGPEQVTVGKGGTLTVQDLIKALPSHLSSQVLSHLEWRDEAGKSIASVTKEGVVTGLAAGSEIVTADYVPAAGVPAVTSWQIKVNVVELGGPVKVAVEEGGSLNLKALLTVAPDTFKTEVKGHLNWTDEPGKDFVSIATNGIVTGKAVGIEKVTASYKEKADGPVIAVWTIQVQVVKINAPSEVFVAKGETVDLKSLITILPAGLTDEVGSNLTWADEAGKNIASVNSTTGIATGVVPGSEKITVTYKDSDGRIVTTRDIVVNVITITGPEEIMLIKGGKPADLAQTLEITPGALKDAVLSHLVWTDETAKEIATVNSSGIVTGKSPGEEKVFLAFKPSADAPATATLNILVRVVEASLAPSVTLTNSGSVQLTDVAHLKITNETDRERLLTQLTWSVLNSQDHATVNAGGLVTPKSLGTDTVLAELKLPISGQVVWSGKTTVNVVELSGRSVQVTLGLKRNLLGDLTRGPSALNREIEEHLSWSIESGLDKLSIDDAGVVTGVRSGQQKAMAIYRPSDGSPEIKAEFSIKVVPVSLELPPSFTMLLDTQYDLSSKLNIKPISDFEPILTFVSWSDTAGNSVVTINDAGKLLANAVGTEKVRARYANPAAVESAEATTEVHVVSIAFPDTVEIGQQAEPRDLKRDLVIEPQSMKNEILTHLTWKDETGRNNVSVDGDGRVTGEQVGEETITAIYSPSDGSPDIPVAVRVKVLPVLLGPSESLTLKRTGTTDLASRLPADLDADVKKNLYWSITNNDSLLAENEDKDTRKSGRLTATAPGTAMVKVAYRKSASGTDIASRTFTIQIVELSLPPKIELSVSNPVAGYNLLNGAAGQLSILPTSPQSLYDQIAGRLLWSDDTNNAVLTVSSAGVVTPMAAGSETVKVVYTPPVNSPLIGEPITASTIIIVNNTPTPGTGGRDHGEDRY
ncbi:DUF5057 domain-containing protein [Cohnella sp. 56]|uniref:DUF5057 domain-containing protein n=1 Tax=Cohnella sp. 56 TaxID=3113722 RepID=UPI0030EAA227